MLERLLIGQLYSLIDLWGKMAGTSNISGQESILYGDNASFDGTERGGAMTTDGQLWIGSSVAPHVRKGTLSSDGTITITVGNGTIQLGVAGGAPVHGSGTDNHLVRWDGTSNIQDSNWDLEDNGSFTLTNGSTTIFQGTTLGQQTSTNTDTNPNNIIRETATNNAPVPIYQFTSQATGAGADGFGARIVYSIETSTASTNNDAVYFDVIWDNSTAGVATARCVWSTNIAGTISEVMNLRGSALEVKTVTKMTGGWATNVTETAVSANVTNAEIIIGVTDTSMARTITLPSTGNFDGQMYIIKDQSGAAATNNISVTVDGGVKTIDGATTQKINSNYGSMTVYWDNTAGNYFII